MVINTVNDMNTHFPPLISSISTRNYNLGRKEQDDRSIF